MCAEVIMRDVFKRVDRCSDLREALLRDMCSHEGARQAKGAIVYERIEPADNPRFL
jgi:hypothetical protein